MIILLELLLLAFSILTINIVVSNDRFFALIIANVFIILVTIITYSISERTDYDEEIRKKELDSQIEVNMSKIKQIELELEELKRKQLPDKSNPKPAPDGEP